MLCSVCVMASKRLASHPVQPRMRAFHGSISSCHHLCTITLHLSFSVLSCAVLVSMVVVWVCVVCAVVVSVLVLVVAVVWVHVAVLSLC